MTLLRSWQQFITDALEYFNTAFDNLARILTNRIFGTLFQKSKQNFIINLKQIFLSDFGHPKKIEESEHSGSDWVSASYGGSAGGKENTID